MASAEKERRMADPNVPRDDREALSMYLKALEKKENLSKIERGELLYNLGNVKQRLKEGSGEAEYRECLAENPCHSEARNNLGLLLMRRGAYNDAIDQFCGSEKYEAHINLGVAYECIGKTERAIEQYEIAVSKNQNDPRPLTNLGNAFMKLEQYEKAIHFHKKAVDLAGHTDATLRFNLALCYEEMNEIDNAISEYEEAIRIDPQNASAHINLALALQMQSAPEEARILYHLETAVQVTPNDLDAWLNLGEFRLAQTHNPNDSLAAALTAFDAACSTDDGQYSPEAYLGKASVLDQMNQIQPAIDTAKQAIRLAVRAEQISYLEDSTTLNKAKTLLRSLLSRWRNSRDTSTHNQEEAPNSIVRGGETTSS